jgi:hypothetical protein
MIQRLRKDDRCNLVNSVELDRAGIKRLHGREVVLIGAINGGWDFRCITDPESARWWAPDMCFQLEQPERKKTDEMKKGQKAILVNGERLGNAGLRKCEGLEIVLKKPDDRTPGRWWFNFVKPPPDWSTFTDYWVFNECIQLLPQTDWGNWMPGDTAVLTNIATLREISMGGSEGKTVTLKRKMTQDEKDGRSYARCYMHEDVWWIILSPTTGDYYVPVRCLMKPEQKQSTAANSYELGAISYVTQTQKEQDSMTMYQVAIVLKPSVIAQQAGAVDKIIVQPATVMALSDNAAIAQVAAENAEAILALKEDKASIQVCTKRFADC